jgi:type IV secretory pathway TraG/TraD family ATPase VirD4
MSIPTWLGPHGQPPGHRPASRGRRGGGVRGDEDLLLYVIAGLAAFLAAAGLLLWCAGQLAGRLAHGTWPHVPPSASAGIAVRLPAHASHPALAWPAGVRTQLGGPVAFYLILAVEVVLVGFAVAAVWLRVVRWRAGARRRTRDRSMQWARRDQIRALLVDGPARGRLLLGRLGRQRVAAEPRASVLVVAPTQAGKTTRLVVPNVLTWTGPMVVTSVKADVLHATRRHRTSRGHVQLFDPTAATGVEAARWSPLLTCTTYEAAERTASWLVQAAGDPDNPHARYWEQLGARLLAPLLYAAAGTARDMTDVARWVDRRAEADVTAILEELGDADALDAWTATSAREERAKDSVYGTAEVLLRAFTSPSVRQATTVDADYDRIDVDRLLDGDNTLYLVAPEHEQHRLRPLFEALVQAVVRAAQDRYARTGKPLDPPLLLMLDEAANIAPLRNLDTLAATGAGQGIQLCTVWQDMAQIDALYTRRAPTVVNGHRARVLLAGQADLTTLDQLSRHIGDDELVRPAPTWSNDGRRSVSEQTSDVRLAPVDYLRQLPLGDAIVLYGNLPPLRLRTTAYYEDRDLRDLAGDGADESDGIAGGTRLNHADSGGR